MKTDRGGTRIRSAARLGTAVCLLVAIVLTSFLAGTQAVLPPELPVAEGTIVSYTVKAGEISSTLRLTVVAAWGTDQSVAARSSGVVTTVGSPDDGLVRAGDILASVNLRPVVAGVGEVPMFRDLRQGVRGGDVRQLEALLVDLGYLKAKPDSAFGSATTAAVKRWQRHLGMKADGVVRAGDVAFIRTLPARVAPRINVGDEVSVGGPLLDVLRSAPTFTGLATATERAQLSTGQSVKVVGPNGEAWPGEISTFVPTDDGRYATVLHGTLCRMSCTALELGGESTLSGTVVLQAPVSGPVVPLSAISRDANGGLSVTTPDGTAIPVTIVGSADGFAVVEGLPVGTEIWLPEPAAGD